MRRLFVISSVGRWRLPRCQAIRVRAAASAARISTSGLGRGDDFDDAAVLQFEPVAGAQHHRFGQIEQEAEAAHAGHGDAAPVALVVIEHHRVDGLARPGAGGNDGMSVQHRLASAGRGAPPRRAKSFVRRARPAPTRKSASRPVSRVLYGREREAPDVTAIPLGRPSPGASSNQPERQGPRTGPETPCGAAHRSYSVLLPAGLAVPPTLPPTRCALAAPFHPYRPWLSALRRRAVCFLWRCPWGRPRRTLSGAVSAWSPDFPPPERRRPSGRLAWARA